jgi:hypothetical protein
MRRVDSRYELIYPNQSTGIQLVELVLGKVLDESILCSDQMSPIREPLRRLIPMLPLCTFQ